jgi:hypothetical protein
MMRELIEKYGI